MGAAVLWADIETRSRIPLKHGHYRYSEDVELLLFAYALGDEDVQVWDATAGPMPEDLELYLADPQLPIVFHNAAFDRVQLARCGIPLPLERVRCTLARAYSVGLPGALGDLSRVMGIPVEDQKQEGRQYINLFCVPDKKTGEYADRHSHPEAWAGFIEYAAGDIVSMRRVAKLMPQGAWDPRELPTWHLDQVINDRGFAVDLELARGAVAEVKAAQKLLKDDVTEATDGLVTSLGQRDRILAFVLAEYGVDLPDLRKSTLEKRVDDPDIPEGARELIRMRLTSSKSSVSKYNAVLRSVNADGRIRGALQYGGASRTLRWSGRIMQPQNLPRPTLRVESGPNKGEVDHELIERGIELLKQRRCWIDYDPIEMASNAIRGVIIAPAGKKLVVADLAGIEGRVVAWVAGEEWKLKAYREFDAGRGPDLYKVGYGASFGVDPTQVTKDQRQIGKVIELACGFQGAVGAFQAMATVYGVNVPDEQALASVKAWRKAHPAIRSFWYAIEDAVRRAARYNGAPVEVGRVKVRWKGSWLSIELPSGRRLWYPKPALEDDESITFGSVNRYTKKWDRTHTYGGKLTENIVQAIARDVIALGMHAAEKAGYLTVLSVHDELVTETEDDPRFTSDELCRLMTAGAPWTKGLPLAAAGFETRRYRKD